MGYWLGKDQGLTPAFLSNLGISMDKTVKSSPLSAGATPAASTAPLSAGVSQQEDTNSCKQACKGQYQYCIEQANTLEMKQECKAIKDQCEADCDEELGGCKISVEVCSVTSLIPNATCPRINKLFACGAQPSSVCQVNHDQQGGGGGDCGEGAGPAYEGCSCGKYYTPTTPGQCAGGYVAVGDRCECQKWCIDIGWGSNCTTQAGAGVDNGTLGEYRPPDQLSGLMGSLYDRANMFLGKKPGFSNSAMANMFGLGFDKIRRGGRLADQATMEALQGEGMLGTGTGTKMLQQNAWNTQSEVADLEREIFLANEAQKRGDLTSFTESATKLFQAGLSYEQIVEGINAARRNEGRTDLALLLQYFSNLLSSYNSEA